MERKLKKPGFMTITEFARKLGVSQPAVSQAIQNGRLVAYDGDGERVAPDFVGRKWLKSDEARADWDNGRLRFDDDERQASLETPSFRVWIDPDLPPDKRSESISAILRYCLDPPRPLAERRRVAVRQALMNRYDGAPSHRAKMLERRYRSYLTSAWRIERGLESLPHPRTTERATPGIVIRRRHADDDRLVRGWRCVPDGEVKRASGKLLERCSAATAKRRNRWLNGEVDMENHRLFRRQKHL